MKKLKAIGLCAALLTVFGAYAADEPIISFHTNIYETYGSTNRFHITLGATENIYVDVDYGFGPVEEEIAAASFDSDAGGMVGTSISMTVSSEGMVKIYGDASKIDFIDFEGCYISDIQFPTLTNVEILNLKHNELTGLDLSHMTKLMALYLDDNPFSQASPLVVGANKPGLAILSMSMTDWVSPSFDIADYPSLRSFQAYSSPSITKIDPTKCPNLLQLTIDGTNVSSVDVSKNPNLLILNVSETKVTELDLSNNPYLTELYAQHEALMNYDYKIASIDISKNPEIQRLYLNGNKLEELDLTSNPKVVSFACRNNRIKALNFDNCPNMTLVDISKNNMVYTTMPLPRTTFSEYNYEQNPIAMDRVYKEGTELDFTTQVVRADSQTDAVLFAVSKSDPGNPVILDDEYFTYNNGKFTLNKAYPDSVFVAFHNTAFAEEDLTTSRVLGKTEEDFGKPTTAITLTTSLQAKQQKYYVGIDGATAENPVKFTVDFGNGTLKEFTATTSGIPAEPNVTGERAGSKTIFYTAEGVDITAFKVDNMRLTAAVTMENVPMLRELEITNCYLSSIDLKWNRCLTKLDLSNNSLAIVDLSEPNAYYTKTMLGDINVSNNKLTTFVTVDPYGLRKLNLSNNLLTSVVTEHATGLTELNIANNKIAELSITDCEVLRKLDASNNNIISLYIPDYCPLESVNISGNKFFLSEIPLPGFCNDYTYAPQQQIEIPTKAPSINLTKQNLTVGEVSTQYEWRYTADNQVVPDGNIRQSTPGRFSFTNPNTGNIYCVISNAALPQFAGDNVLRTTAVETADVPENAFAQFKVKTDARISAVFGGVKGKEVIYVDWTGDGDYEQYILTDGYEAFTDSVTAGTTVKCYSYEENDGVKVFSIRNVELEYIDISNMKSINCFGLSGSKVPFENITFPSEPVLGEFIGDTCDFESIDCTPLQNVYYLQLSNNKFTSIDVSPLKNLQCLYLSYNQLTEVKLDNPKLWDLSLTGNQLETIDFSKAKAVSQLYLSNNKFKTINLDGLSLKVLFLDGNYFDLQTLPLPSDSYFVYNYFNQHPIEATHVNGVVDLSSQFERNGVKSEYTWFIDTPYFDEDGNLLGEDLFVDEEYTIENGVTSFLKPFNNVMCVITNGLFPNLYLYTNLMDVESSGLDSVAVDNNAPVEYFNLQGIKVETPTAPGVYIRRQGNISQKVLVK